MSAQGLFARCAAWASAALLISCIGGTGTDTDNGVNDDARGPLAGFSGTAAFVVDGDGKPLAGVDLVLHTPGFRGDSSAPENLLVDAAAIPRSDSLGFARFNLARSGRYVVEAILGGTPVFFDTLAVADVKSLSVFTVRTRPTRPVKGAVRLESGLGVDSGTVFLRGTGRFARIDSSGAFDLGPLPVDAGRLAIGLTYRAGIREVRIAVQKPDTSKVPVIGAVKPTYTCREVNADSAARSGILAGGSTTAAPSQTAATDPAKLDTAKAGAVLRACDSVPAGTVIRVIPSNSVSSVPQAKGDTATSVIAVGNVVSGDLPAASGENRTSEGQKLVPLSGCVATPGQTVTSYDVDLFPTASGSDLLVGDVDGRCLR